jgi:uncharacterized membrane protein
VQSLFAQYGDVIVWLHVFSAFVWVGGMIAVRFAVHPMMQQVEDPKLKLGTTLKIMGRFFHLVMPFIFIILMTAIMMLLATGSTPTAYIKEGIWAIMTANFTWIYFKRSKGQKAFDRGDIPLAKSSVALIPKLLLPINIVLGLIALWLGVILRGL